MWHPPLLLVLRMRLGVEGGVDFEVVCPQQEANRFAAGKPLAHTMLLPCQLYACV